MSRNSLTQPRLPAQRTAVTNRKAIDNDAKASLKFDGTGNLQTSSVPIDFSTQLEGSYVLWVKFIGKPTFNQAFIRPRGVERLDMTVEASTRKVFVWFKDEDGAQGLVGKVARQVFDNKWHFYVMNKKATAVEFWADNILVGSYNTTKKAPAISLSYNINTGNNLIFLIKDVLFFNESLSPAQIENLYYNNIKPYSPVLDLGFNEGAGAVAYDTSGNANHGTITGATWSSDTPTKARTAIT
jgi:hypothetical protein